MEIASHTECITNIDYKSEMIIFELIMTTLKASVFEATRAIVKNGLSLKLGPCVML